MTVLNDGRIQLDHLMTTGIGGWVPTLCFNHLFKSALIEANAHESEAMRDYVLSLLEQSGSGSELQSGDAGAAGAAGAEDLSNLEEEATKKER